MYLVKTKKVGGLRYRTMQSFKTYREAYAFIGDYLQEIDTLHWGGRRKKPCMYDGYCKEKLFIFGTMQLRRKNRIYLIKNNTPELNTIS